MSDTIITPKLSVDKNGDLRVDYENCCDYVGYTDEYTVVRLDSAQRRALIDHLLALEVAERCVGERGVVIETGARGTWFGPVFLGDSDLLFIHGAERTLCRQMAYLPMPEGLDYCLFAALAEKRRREATDG